MRRSILFAVLLAAVMGALPAHAPADALRDVARVVATTPGTLYLDAGRAQGLHEGQRFTTNLAGQPVTVLVVAVTSSTAVVRVEGAVPALAVGAEVALPAGRAAPPAPVAPRAAPAASVPWIPSLAADALPRVGFGETPDVVSGASRRQTELLVHGELAARASVGADLGQESRSSTITGLSGNLSAELGSWSWAHAWDLHYAARPELLAGPFRNGTLRFDVYLARLGWKSESGNFAANLGRMSAAEGTSVGLVDGGRVTFVAAPDVELGAWAGARPDLLDLSPELLAPSAGLVAHFGSRHPGQLSARADLAFAADAWRGSVDRAFANARAGVDLPGHVSVDGEAVVDLADDASEEATTRLSRATATVRGRFARGVLDVRAHAGLDDPVLTRSLVERLALRPEQFPQDRRHWYGRGSVDVRVTDWLLVDAGLRADDGDDDYHSLAGEAGVRILDVGPLGSELWARGQVLTGTLLEGAGGEIGWLAPLHPFAHVDVSYALDVWRLPPSPDAELIHRVRLSLDRRFGPRWRATLSTELATGSPSRALAFLLVGYRF